jgi:hypothetical protein
VSNSLEQSDFGAGIYRGRKAPAASVFDAVNALVDDEGQLFARGKSAYFDAATAGFTLTGIADLYLAPGRRLVAWGPGSGLLALNEVAHTFASVAPTPESVSRAVQLGSIGVFQRAPGSELLLYAGSLKTTSYNTGTVSIAAGSTALTGVGTSWLANVDVGMLMEDTGATAAGVVASVDSDTAITLREAWAGATLAGSGATFAPYFSTPPPASAASLPAVRSFAASVGSPGRLVMGFNNRAYFSEPGAVELLTDQYHELPASEVITGADSIEDTLILFTTGGVWIVENMAFDVVDDVGNVQHRVAQVSKDVILWGDAGISAWAGAFVVPAVEDIYLFSPDGTTQVVSEAIRPLYRSYVKAGYQPGAATVHRGHYLLPILNGTTLVDELVCRLDRPYQTPGGRTFRPFTRWSGEAASAAYTQRVGASTRAPKLLGVSGVKVTDLTSCMSATGGAATQDADATTPTVTIDTNDFDLGPGIRPNTVEKARAVYETTGGTPTVTVKSAVGPESASWTTATAKRGAGSSDGTGYSAWRVNRKAERMRFRFECSSQVTSLILRRLELTVRQAGQN